MILAFIDVYVKIKRNSRKHTEFGSLRRESFFLSSLPPLGLLFQLSLATTY